MRTDETPIQALVRRRAAWLKRPAEVLVVHVDQLVDDVADVPGLMATAATTSWDELRRLDKVNDATDCDHDGQLVEVPALGEVRCEACGEMAPTVEKHFGG